MSTRCSLLASLASLASVASLAPLAPLAMAQAPDDTVRVGDRVLLRVEPGLTDSARQQSDTLAVTPGPALLLPGVGELSLAGVRRVDIEPYLTRQLARFLKNPEVHARVLVRLSILGEVARPGFYAVPADAAVTDAIMAAGGPTRDSKVGGARIERDAVQLWSGEQVQGAIARGLTLDQMKLRSGDCIIVRRRHDAATTAQIFGILLTLPAAIYGLTKLF